MSTFTAIADPIRRDILALLRQGEQPAGALVESLALPQPWTPLFATKYSTPLTLVRE